MSAMKPPPEVHDDSVSLSGLGLVERHVGVDADGDEVGDEGDISHLRLEFDTGAVLLLPIGIVEMFSFKITEELEEQERVAGRVREE